MLHCLFASAIVLGSHRICIVPQAINTIADRYGAVGKRVYLRRLSSDCAKLLAKVSVLGMQFSY